ncbi:Plasmodium vivax Vir protein, putative [Plasmodium vivax]|uniref:Vir protein, putative n=1 Tax=Plasmodium vivax TaxID=5855 RepID=A0A1G4E968_PLAVI|nr:Plasmodium vivax Vir protein, putative [Plasmodium vivax]
MALSPENNWVEVLENLPSYKEYEKFDKVDIKNENSNHCNNLGSKDEGDKTFCKQIVQNVSQLSALENDQKIKNSCYYFQHWFFDNIAKKYYDGNEWGNNYSVAKELYNIISTIAPLSSKMAPCKCYESGSPDDWKKEKYLHDYFENHQDIKCSNSGKDRCEKYIQYVTYINNLYQEKEYKCCDGDELDEEGFCESYFKCENMYNPKNLLIKLQKELQSLGKEPEVPREGGAVEAGRAPVSGGEEREKKTHEDEVSAETTGKESKEKLVAGEVPKEKGADSPAQSKELELAEKRTEAPREGGARAVEAGKALGSGGEEREKKTHEDEVSAEATGKESKEKLVAGEVPKEKGADSPAQSVPEKDIHAQPDVTEPAGAKLGGLESREEHPASAKTVGEKPPAEKPLAQESGGAIPAPSEGAPAKPVATKPPAAAKEDEVTGKATGKESKEKLVAGEVPKEKEADSLAQSAAEKSIPAKSTVPESVGAKPGGSESREKEPASAKLVGKKPPEENPRAPESGGAIPTPSEGAPAKPVATKPPADVTEPAGAKLGGLESREEHPASAKTVGEKPPAEKPLAQESGGAIPAPSEGAPAKPVATKPPAARPVAVESETVTPARAESEAALVPPPIESFEQGSNVISSHNTEPASNALPLTIADTPNILGTTHEELDSNFFRNVIMAIAVLGTIFFLFYYNRSSRLESSLLYVSVFKIGIKFTQKKTEKGKNI